MNDFRVPTGDGRKLSVSSLIQEKQPETLVSAWHWVQHLEGTYKGITCTICVFVYWKILQVENMAIIVLIWFWACVNPISCTANCIYTVGFGRYSNMHKVEVHGAAMYNEWTAEPLEDEAYTIYLFFFSFDTRWSAMHISLSMSSWFAAFLGSLTDVACVCMCVSRYK